MSNASQSMLFLLRWWLVLCLLFPPTANAQSIGEPAVDNCFAEITGDNTADFSSPDAQAVRAAVDAAPAGGTVKIAGTCAGVLNGTVVVVDKPLTLAGGYAPTAWATPNPWATPTHLDALGQGRVISASQPFTATNLTLQNGAVSDEGGGLRVSGGAGTMVLISTRFLSNTAQVGGGAYVASAATLQGNEFSHNTAGSGGGAMFTGPASLSANQFNHNTATSGFGGGAYFPAAAATLQANSFSANSARNGGGAFFSSGAPATLEANTFISNTANTGLGGGVALISALPLLSHNVFQQNTALGGGGVYLSGPPATLQGNVFLTNTAQVSGGGAYWDSGMEVAAAGEVFRGNSAQFGGGVAVARPGVFLTPTFVANSASDQGGGLYISSGVAVQLTNGLWARNTAANTGAALYVNNAAPVYLHHATIVPPLGGAPNAAVYVNSGEVFITNTLITSHTVGLQQAAGASINAWNTLFFGNTNNTLGGVFNTDPMQGDPQFVAAALDDYHLTASSAARDAGIDAGVPTDFDGDARPQGSGFDIGFDEFVAAALPACFATPNDGATLFSSADAQAVRDAVDSAPAGGTVKLAGYCPGVVAQGGTTQTVLLTKTLTLAGGYTLTNWLTPDYALNPTTLDALGQGRVVSASVDATLQGFTVTNGYISRAADGGALGGGIYAAGALTLSQMMVYSNVVTGFGYGGGACIFGNANLTGTTFSANVGGGADFEGLSTLVNTTFINNTSNVYDGGGATFFDKGILINSRFINNTTSQSGGGIAAYSGITAVNTIFADNTAGMIGGGAYFLSGFVILTSTTFSNNVAQDQGGGAYFWNIAAKIKDTTFISNTANTEGGGAWFFYPPLLMGETSFISNTAGNRGGGVFSGGMVITNARFISNNAQQGGGAYLRYGDSLANALFANNVATSKGAAIYVEYVDHSKVIHTTIASSIPVTTSAIYIATGTVYLTNTLITSHTIGIENAGGMVSEDYTLFDSVPTPYSGTVLSGGHSFTGSAAFVNPAAGDYHLTANSAARDAGIDAGVPTDFDGDARPQGSGFDIGFDELAATLPPTCFATPNDGATLFSSADSQAVRDAVGAAAPNSIVKIAGYCPGVVAQGGTTQTVLLTKTLTLAGGYTLTNWLTPDYTQNPTTLDALGQGRVVNASVDATLQGFTVTNGYISDPVGGGGINASGAMTLSQMTILSNTNVGASISGTAILSNIVFQNNFGAVGGAWFNSLAFLTNTAFISNSAIANGGGAHFRAAAVLRGVSFIGNVSNITSGPNGGGGAIFDDSVVLANSDFRQNRALKSGGGALFRGNTILTNTIFADNSAESFGGGAYFFLRPSVATNVEFNHNTAFVGGGAYFQGSTTLVAARFIRNTSVGGGGGAFFTYPKYLINTLFGDNNTLGQGAAMFVTGMSNSSFIYTTIATSVPITTSAIYIANGTAFITNTLIASHTVGIENAGGMVNEDYTLFDSVPTPYSGTVLSGGHSLTGTAAFVNPAAGDYHLTAISAARDAGIDAGVSTDFDGDARPQGSGFDIGFDEFVAAALPACFATPNDGATVFSSADAQAVRDAIDSAPAGGTVKLAGYCPGVVAQGGTTQTVLLTKTLTLAGGYTLTNWLTPDYAQNPTTLDALGQGRVVSASVSATLMGFTVTNGIVSLEYAGGGIRATEMFTLQQMTIYSNTGGGAYFGASAYLTGNTFISNTGHNTIGGGASFYGPVVLANNIFRENHSDSTSGFGGGGGAFFMSTAVLTNNSFISNTGRFGGGAFFRGNAPVTLTTNTFIGNIASATGGGAYFLGQARLTETTFIQNNAGGGGGAIFISEVTMARAVFSSNTSVYNGGGGYFQGAVTMTDTLFVGNTAPLSGGGAFFVNSSTRQLQNVLFANNKALGNGAAIYILGNTTTLNLLHTTIAASVPITTSAIYIATGTVFITNTLIASHTVGIENISGTVHADYGLFDSVSTPYSGTVLSGGHSLTGSAAFVNPAASDYRLRATSAALDAGVNAGVMVDYEGDVRPQGNGFDIGFDEALPSRLLSVFYCAFDNAPDSTLNLTRQFPAFISTLQHSAQADPRKTIVAICDLDGSSDTHIRVFQGTQQSLISGLPNAAGALDPTLHEYNMTAAADLAGALRWALNTYADPTTQILVTYIGHGTYLGPRTDITTVFTLTNGLLPLSPGGFPLPARIDEHPDLTDMHPPALFAPEAFAQALNGALQAGPYQVQVLDVVHCGAGTVEEVNSLAPYAARALFAKPYAYWSPALTGAALDAVQVGQTPQQMAEAILGAYHTTLQNADDPATPYNDHPHFLFAVDPTLLPKLRQAWDNTTHYLNKEYQLRPAPTRANLLGAYMAGPHDDTTFCARDFACAPPDQLTDFTRFAENLARRFGPLSPISLWATTAAQLARTAITARYSANGVPHFAAPQTPHWDFSRHVGFDLFTPFTGTVRNGVVYLPWQIRFYTENPLNGQNPQPYAWVLQTQWDTTLQLFWANQLVKTEACLPALPTPLQVGEVAALYITAPPVGTVSLGTPARVGGVISTAQALNGVAVRFTVQQLAAEVYSATINTGYLPAGAVKEIFAPLPWSALVSGTYTVTLTVDPDQTVVETNETNNTVTQSDEVWLWGPRPWVTATLAAGQQFIPTATITLNLQGTASPMSLGFSVFQYPEHLPANTQVMLPQAVYETWLSDVTLPTTIDLAIPPAVLHPGPVVIYIWGVSSAGPSVQPAVVRYNYVPPATALAAGSDHYFLVALAHADVAAFNLQTLSGEANLFAWDPYSFGPPPWAATAMGNDVLAFTAPLAGTYLLQVHAESATQYTLTFNRNGQPGLMGARPTPAPPHPAAYAPNARPMFIDPVAKFIFQQVYLPFVQR